MNAAMPAPRIFAIVCDPADLDDEDCVGTGHLDEAEDVVVVGHGMELPDGHTVFVWVRGPGGGGGAYGRFDSPERARRLVDRMLPAKLVWFDPVS